MTNCNAFRQKKFKPLRFSTISHLVILGVIANIPLSMSAEVETQILSADEIKSTEVESDDRLELKTSVIKGNKELPQVLYIVPWQTIKKEEKAPGNLVLHSLYGDIFTPVTPEKIATDR